MRSITRPCVVVAVAVAMMVSTVAAQGLSPLEESDRIFGLGEAGKRGSSTRGGRKTRSSTVARVAQVNYPLVFLFHPHMTHLRYNLFHNITPHFEGNKKLPMPSRKVRQDRRRKRHGLLEQRAREQRYIQNLLARLNVTIKSGGGKAAEKRYWERKAKHEEKIRDIDARIVLLDRIEKNPIERVRSARRRVLRKVEGEIKKVIAWVAKRRNIGVVFNSSGLPMLAARDDSRPVRRGPVAWGREYRPTDNPYSLFLKTKLAREKRGSSAQGLALLSAWHAAGPKALSRLPDVGQRTLLFGGTDLTWTVLEVLLRKYKFPPEKIRLVKKYVSRMSEVSHAKW